MPNWNDVLKEIQSHRSPFDVVRTKYLHQLHQHTQRNIIIYYSGWLSKPGLQQANIDDEDKNGFMMAVHKMDKTKGLDLVLHTPGGRVDSTHSIVHYLHQMFGRNIRAIVPQIAMSAGTMIACSCKEILMAKHSNLGPIDPMLGGVPAAGVLDEFETAKNEIKNNPHTIPLWREIIGKYHPTFLSQCQNAIDWSDSFVKEQLATVMFYRHKNAKNKAKEIVAALSNYHGNKRHERHLHYDECKSLGLKVLLIEQDQKLQDLVLTVHHCYMHLLMNTPAYKIIENHMGLALIKNVAGPNK